MKALARQYFWWPNLDKDIEKYVKSCEACMTFSRNPELVKLTKFTEAKEVFDRVHIDFMGPFKGKMFLIITDSYSKWPEIYLMNKIDSENTIEKLRDCLSRFGLLNKIISDNGTQFLSEEFQKFCRHNDIKHITSAPYHPATNGAAENAVKSFKIGLKKALYDERNRNVSLLTIITRYLFAYRNTPHCVTNETPSTLMLKRNIKTRLNILNKVDSDKQLERQIKYFKGNREVSFEEEEVVYVKDYRTPGESRWTKAKILKVLGISTYLCKVMDDASLTWKRHADQIVKTGEFYGDYIEKLEMKELEKAKLSEIEMRRFLRPLTLEKGTKAEL
nr:uncharacterized protein K02A2.6-like [Onthophagus taurus]